jgi:hypothetical protein
MPSFRDIKRSARRVLHETMKIPAYLFATSNAEPISIFVRRSVETVDGKAFAGGQPGLAQMVDAVPTLLFMRSELAERGVDLKRNMIITLDEGEGYNLDLALPIDDITVSWRTTRLSAREMDGLPYPGSTDV